MSETGRRVTRQRRAVAEALSAVPGFVSAQALHARLREDGDAVGLATVYRSLARLVEDGRADMIRHDDGEALYRRCSTATHHHHLVCRVCGSTVEFETPAEESRLREVAARHRFTDVRHVLEAFGICEACAGKSDSAAR